MPIIHRIGSFTIRIFTRDHEPIHVHAMTDDFTAKTFLDGSILVLRGKKRVPVGFVAVVAWVQANNAAIIAVWERTRPR